jgi:hypothetical protein
LLTSVRASIFLVRAKAIARRRRRPDRPTIAYRSTLRPFCDNWPGRRENRALLGFSGAVFTKSLPERGSMRLRGEVVRATMAHAVKTISSEQI